MHQVRVALGGRRLRGAQSFREKSTSNITPFSGQVLGSHETPFRPISPEWVWRRLADYVAVKMSRQGRDRAVPETTTPRRDGGVRTSFPQTYNLWSP
jgi:hypothetical protein